MFESAAHVQAANSVPAVQGSPRAHPTSTAQVSVAWCVQGFRWLVPQAGSANLQELLWFLEP
jgi:hypothetical protein